jgi:hypothetical protein
MPPAQPPSVLPQFKPGQRWLSETQAELGLGIVEASDERTVTMRFPATGEQRQYARRSAPLWRAEFAVGDPIHDIEGLLLNIVDVADHDGLLVYTGEDADGERHQVPEQLLAPDLHLNRPQQKLLAGDSTVTPGSGCASAPGATAATGRDWTCAVWWARASRRSRTSSTSPARSPTGWRRGSCWPTRWGWARPSRPAWSCTGCCSTAAPAGCWCWCRSRCCTSGWWSCCGASTCASRCSTASASARPRRRQRLRERAARALQPRPAHRDPGHAAAVLGADWDLLIVDEAHHLHWTPEDSGLDYDLVEALADQTPAVLLLTATPEQLGRTGHFGRLRLLDPERFSRLRRLLAEEAGLRPIAEIAGRLLAGEPLTPTTSRHCGRCSATRRSCRRTRSSSGCSIATAPAHPVPQHPRRRRWASRSGAPSHPAARARRLRRRRTDPLHPELGAGSDWPTRDPRVPWLVETLRELHPAKVLLIAAKAETVLALRAHLHERAGMHAAVFHEGMEIVERDRAAAYFADPEEGTRLLLCSEIGSEGRNFQFAHHLVLFDLPLDPELLEQRIGRLDRIGQTRRVEIHVPYLAGTAMETLYRWYAEGLDAFGRHCPAAPAVFEQLGARLRRLLLREGPR